VRIVNLPDRYPAKVPLGRPVPIPISPAVTVSPPARRKRSPLRSWPILGSFAGAGMVSLAVLVFAGWMVLRDSAAVEKPGVAQSVAGIFQGHAAEVVVTAPLPQSDEAAPSQEPTQSEANSEEKAEPAPEEEAVKEEAPPAAPLAPPAPEPVVVKVSAPVRPDRCYGTSVEFTDNPKEAVKQAVEQSKLLLVLTISGNFEDSKFT